MVNAGLLFGMDADDETVLARTVDWAVSQGIETATFHILTPYPGTGLYQRMQKQGRLLHSRWDQYDTRHVVFRPARLEPAALEAGYWRAYPGLYCLGSVPPRARTETTPPYGLRHTA